MKNKTEYGLAEALILAGILINVAQGQPKVSAANRETIRIMKTIKIPPPYTPVYQPYVWQQRYLPSVDATPDYSPKVGPVQQPFSIPKSPAALPSILPVTATNSASASVTNVPVTDKAAKMPASAATKEKVASQPTDKAPMKEKK